MTSKVYTNLHAAVIERFINLSGSDKQKQRIRFRPSKKNSSSEDLRANTEMILKSLKE